MQERKQYKISLPMTEHQKNKVEELLNLVTDFYATNVILEEIENPEEVQEEKEWPQDGDTFCFIDSDGDIIVDCFDPDDSTCKRMLSIGNCFKIEEEAEFEVERLKVLAEMRKFAESESRKWDNFNEHWCLIYDCNAGSIQCHCRFQYKYDGIYFESKEKMRECLASVGEDRIKKYYLRIKE